MAEDKSNSNQVGSDEQERRAKSGWISRLVAIISVILLVLLTANLPVTCIQRRRWSSMGQVSGHSIEEGDYPQFVCGTNEQPYTHPARRYDVGEGYVAAWPSTGGVWIKDVSPIEVQALGLDRWTDTEKSNNATQEDVFCERLRTFGADFYTLPPEYPLHRTWCESMPSCVDPQIRFDVQVGFPETGGAWILNMTDERNQHHRGKFHAHLRQALNMTERCQVIEWLGGRFCEDVTACMEEYGVVKPPPPFPRGSVEYEWWEREEYAKRHRY